MLRYKTETRPGLVALYDIRSGNGAGQFLQPGARTGHLLLSGPLVAFYAYSPSECSTSLLIYLHYHCT